MSETASCMLHNNRQLYVANWMQGNCPAANQNLYACPISCWLNGTSSLQLHVLLGLIKLRLALLEWFYLKFIVWSAQVLSDYGHQIHCRSSREAEPMYVLRDTVRETTISLPLYSQESKKPSTTLLKTVFIGNILPTSGRKKLKRTSHPNISIGDQ